jgi:hypothetical protein
MNETQRSTEDYDEPELYEIRIKGHLHDRWAAWFDGLTLRLEENGDTLLTGPVVDQAALHGWLRKVRFGNGSNHGNPCQTSPGRCVKQRTVV